MKTFNLNEYILVQITDIGWKHLETKVTADYIKHCIIPYKQIIEEKDYYRLQAHQVASLFGDRFYCNPVPIDMNILIPEKD